MEPSVFFLWAIEEEQQAGGQDKNSREAGRQADSQAPHSSIGELLMNFFYTSGLLMVPLGNEYFKQSL